MTDRTRVDDEIALRRASIDDARREYAAGDLSADELSRIERDEAALILALEARASSRGAPEPVLRPERRPRRRGLLYAGAVALMLAGAGIGLEVALGGSSPTTSDSARVGRLLAQAETEEAGNQNLAALSFYLQVLGLEPHNLEALTQAGWLEFSAGSSAQTVNVIRRGEQLSLEAVHLGPGDPGARLYYAIEAASTPRSHDLAVRQFKVFLKLKPSSALMAVARPWLTALKISSS